MISILPCIEDKCLLLPICKTKEIITCNPIFKILDDIHNESFNSGNKKYSLLIDKLKEIFPILDEIRNTNEKHLYYFQIKE